MRQIIIIPCQSLTISLLQQTIKDFTARSAGILQESMKWTPQSVRSSLIEYLIDIEAHVHLTSQTGVMPATGSVLSNAGYSSSPTNLQVSQRYALFL